MRTFALSLFVMAILTGCLAVSAVKTTGKVAGAAAGVAIGTTGKVVKGSISLVTSDDEDEKPADNDADEDVQNTKPSEIDA